MSTIIPPFDQQICRRNTGSMKWDEDPSIKYPLWVADMDFQAAPCIIEALRSRVEHGIFGYALPLEPYFESIIRWHSNRHGVEYKREWIIPVPGIVPAISAILRAMTNPGGGVILFSPAYNCFYSSIRNLQCRVEECQLIRTEDKAYKIDFNDLESRAMKTDVTVMLLCSPHNPCGRVWSKEELQRIADICLRHNVFIISDEIHCELTMPGYEFIPYASLGEPYLTNSCTCTSASKAFNIAGLQNAQIIIANEKIRERIDRAVNIHEVCDINPMGIVATQAAYSKEGDMWLEQLRQYIWDNYQAAKTYLVTEIPDIFIADLQATYLMWVDIRSMRMPSDELCNRMKSEDSVWFAPGSMYGTGGEGYIRINLATQHERLMKAVQILKKRRYIGR